MKVRGLAAAGSLIVVSLLISLAVAEAVLRTFTPFPVTGNSNRQPDANFGYVAGGGVPDVDARGFRNRGVNLDDADVVVVGDSHVYGYNVDVTHAFPYVLGKLTGRRVYAMGVGGYGVYQYLALIDALLRKPPAQVLLALYPANDLGSACTIVGLPTYPSLAARAGISIPACGAPPTKPPSLLERSALVGAIHYAWMRYATRTCAEPAIRFTSGPCLTIVPAERHSRLTSLETAENRQRLADAFGIMRYANDRLRERGATFSVLIIPSRERVLLEWSRRYSDQRDARLDLLVDGEISLAGRFQRYLDSQQIPNLDATDDVVRAFAAAVERGEVFYPRTEDGHPFAEGYAAYAAAAARLLERDARNDAGR